MMTTEHDEALVERVALAMARTVDIKIPDDWAKYGITHSHWMDKAHAVIYPPTPPKTRLQVARELFAQSRIEHGWKPDAIMRGGYDDTSEMKAILAALALPAMED